MEAIFRLRGKEKGQNSVIFVAVHGNEPCGYEAIKSLLPTLHIKAGNVTFVIANPRALKERARFTEANLNRMFKPDHTLSMKERESYEYKRAQKLKVILNQADVLLDIHASSTKGSEPFIICEANGFEIANKLPVKTIVSGFDAVEPGGTDYYMNSIGKIGICMECGFLGDESAVDVAREGIISFLIARGHIDGNESVKTQRYIEMYDIYITKENFVPVRIFSDFEQLAKGTLLGMDGGREIRAEKDSIILFTTARGRMGEEAFLLGEIIK